MDESKSLDNIQLEVIGQAQKENLPWEKVITLIPLLRKVIATRAAYFNDFEFGEVRDFKMDLR